MLQNHFKSAIGHRLLFLMLCIALIPSAASAEPVEFWVIDLQTGVLVSAYLPSLDYTMTGSWSGAQASGKAEGRGVFYYEYSLPDGKAEWCKAEGEMKAGRLDGYVSVQWSNGSRYTGYYALGFPEGRGTYIWPSGASYEGDFQRGVREGHGKYKWLDGTVYEGDFIGNMSEGQGTLLWPDGSVYTGEFSKGRKHGKGRLKWPDGSTYEGGWIEDKAEGYGISRDSFGRITYQGQWRNNQPSNELIDHPTFGL